jgi:NTE family protein
MNAITSPNVYVRSATSASSSIPGMFAAERLYAKGFDGKPRPYLASRRWVDGSLSGDLPAKRLARLYGANHFIVSMINPAVAPFIRDVTMKRSAGFGAALAVGGVRAMNELVKVGERILARRGKMGSLLASRLRYLANIVDQDYLGDINVLLEKEDFKWRHAVFEFEDGEIEKLVDAGMRRTWPKISRIRNAALISRMLDRIVEDLGQQGMTPKERQKHHQYV